MNDLIDYRRRKLRAERHAGSMKRWADLSYTLEVRWPGGVLGWLCGAVLLLSPVWLLILVTWALSRLYRWRCHKP